MRDQDANIALNITERGYVLENRARAFFRANAVSRGVMKT